MNNQQRDILRRLVDEVAESASEPSAPEAGAQLTTTESSLVDTWRALELPPPPAPDPHAAGRWAALARSRRARGGYWVEGLVTAAGLALGLGLGLGTPLFGPAVEVAPAEITASWDESTTATLAEGYLDLFEDSVEQP